MKPLIGMVLALAVWFLGFSDYMTYEISSAEKAVNKVMGRNSKNLANKYQVSPFAVTVGMPHGDIKTLELSFQVYGSLSKDRIRILLLDMVHDFLDDINSDSDLTNHLKNNFLKIEEIGITLFVNDSKGCGLNHPDISIARISEGNLVYLTVTSGDVITRKSREVETYEEALRLATKTRENDHL